MKAIRWLGAFRRESSLADSLLFELRRSGGEVAAEGIKKGMPSAIEHARIGLLVKRRAIKRVFSGDVWSVTAPDGRLVPTRKPVGKHWECFCAPEYVAIVIDDRESAISDGAMETCLSIGRQYGLPVLRVMQTGIFQEVGKKN